MWLGKLGKLAVHPVANFVVARAVMRLSEVQLQSALDEMDGIWSKLISELSFFIMVFAVDTNCPPKENSRTGVIKACIERSVELSSLEDRVVAVSVVRRTCKPPPH